MSLTKVAVSQSASYEESRTFFGKGGFVVTHPYKIKAKKKRQEDLEVLAVLLDESSEPLKGSCYRAVYRLLNEDDRLRECVTGSRSRVTLDQVIDSGGYGIFTMTEPLIGKHVLFRYYPRVDRHFLRPGISLATCGLGCVVPTPLHSAAS